MVSPLLFDCLRKELAKRGLPRRYVERIVQELEDHQEDILEEPAAANVCSAPEEVPSWRRLGDPIQLAEAIAAEFRRATFAGRHPIFTYLAAPVPLTFLAWFGWMLLFHPIMGWFITQEPGRGTLQWPPLFIWSVLTWYYASMILPSALAAGLCCRWGFRSGRANWSLAGCALIAVFAGSMASSMKLSAFPMESTYGVGSLLLIPFVGYAGVDWTLIQQFLQMAVPLGIGTGFVLLHRRKVRRLLVVGQ
jgi:hypothetical protein